MSLQVQVMDRPGETLKLLYVNVSISENKGRALIAVAGEHKAFIFATAEMWLTKSRPCVVGWQGLLHVSPRKGQRLSREWTSSFEERSVMLNPTSSYAT